MTENSKSKYDLEERTAKFAEDIIKFAKKIPKNVITLPIIDQLVKRELVLAQIIARLMMPNLKWISDIK